MVIMNCLHQIFCFPTVSVYIKLWLPFKENKNEAQKRVYSCLDVCAGRWPRTAVRAKALSKFKKKRSKKTQPNKHIPRYMLNWTHCDTVSEFLSFLTFFTAYLGLDCDLVLPACPGESQGMHFPTPLRRTGRKGAGKGKLAPPSHPIPLQVNGQQGQEQTK